MKEGNVTLDELAAKLDQFGYDFDPYGYMDAVGTREEGFEQIREELRKGHLSGFREYLKEIVEEEGDFAGEAEDILRLWTVMRAEESSLMNRSGRYWIGLRNSRNINRRWQRRAACLPRRIRDEELSPVSRRAEDNYLLGQ